MHTSTPCFELTCKHTQSTHFHIRTPLCPTIAEHPHHPHTHTQCVCSVCCSVLRCSAHTQALCKHTSLPYNCRESTPTSPLPQAHNKQFVCPVCCSVHTCVVHTQAFVQSTRTPHIEHAHLCVYVAAMSPCGRRWHR